MEVKIMFFVYLYMIFCEDIKPLLKLNNAENDEV